MTKLNRILALAALPMLLVGCPMPPPAPHTPATPAADDPGPAPAPASPDDPFDTGVADPPQPARPAAREPVTPPVVHRPPPVTPPVTHRPPPERRPVALRPAPARRPVVAGTNSLEQKRTSILQLGRTRDPSSVDALVRYLDRREPVNVRALAAEALGRLGASWSVRALASLLSVRSTKLRSAARKSLAKICRAPSSGTAHYLRIVPPQDTLPKALHAGPLLMLSMAKSYRGCPDCILRWPHCPGGGRRLVGFEIQPQIKVTKSGGSTSLHVSVLILTHPKQALKGTLSAKATFDVDLSRPFVKYVLQSLTDHLRGNIDQFVRQLR